MATATGLSRFDLTGRVALVTGAGRGLGFEIARALAHAGAEVHVNGRDRTALDAACARLAEEGVPAARAHPAPFDVADLDAAASALDALTAGRGLDILVNNMGQRLRRPLEKIEPEDFARLVAIDLTAVFALSRRAALAMKARGSGRIVNVTTIVAELAAPENAAYIAAKGGLASLTRGLAAELGPHGVTVNAIAPGFFATETNARIVDDPGVGPAWAQRTPLRRWGRPEEIGGAAVFLCSDAGSYVNGHTLTVDGGVSATF